MAHAHYTKTLGEKYENDKKRRVSWPDLPQARAASSSSVSAAMQVRSWAFSRPSNFVRHQSLPIDGCDAPPSHLAGFLPAFRRVRTAPPLLSPSLPLCAPRTQTLHHKAWLLPVTHPTAHMDMPAGVARRLSLLYPPPQSPVQFFQSCQRLPCRWLYVPRTLPKICGGIKLPAARWLHPFSHSSRLLRASVLLSGVE